MLIASPMHALEQININSAPQQQSYSQNGDKVKHQVRQGSRQAPPVDARPRGLPLENGSTTVRPVTAELWPDE